MIGSYKWELIRQYQAMLLNTALGSETLATEIDPATESAQIHWSELDNVEVFKTLQMHPKWGDFFKTFGEGAEDAGDMVTWW